FSGIVRAFERSINTLNKTTGKSKMLKEQLLAEAQNLDTPVELDSIFESVELSDDVKATFTTVFEQAGKAGAARLAESHITQIPGRCTGRVGA
ncbi:hypothetical protein J9332_40220, partial [Aquimarina celericrescens]|nr:hypothetical protein [Aquimarina celericrescens]